MSNFEFDASIREEAARKSFPQYDSAILHKAAEFSTLAETHFGSQEKFAADPVRRLAHQRYHPQLVQAFEAKHGKIVKIIYADNYLAGAVLTDKADLDLIYPLESVEIEKRFFRCELVQIQAQTFLNLDDRKVCSDSLYAVATHLLDLLDAGAEKLEQDGEARLLSLDDQLEKAEMFCHSAALRNAHIQYFFGMIAGIIVLALLAALFEGIWVYRAGLPGMAIGPLVGSLLAGGVGAVLSVLSRMTAGSLLLNYEVGTVLTRLIGAFRPLVGAIFGATLYMCLASGLLSFIALPGDATKQVYFFCSVGVIAGFNERWAQDMLAISGDRLRTQVNAPKSHRPRRGPSKGEPTKADN